MVKTNTAVPETEAVVNEQIRTDKGFGYRQSIIDKEHRELLQAVNKLLDACGEGKGRVYMGETIKFLNDYVDRHFSHEELLQKQSNYPGFIPHKMFHDKYKQTLREITGGISASGPSISELSKLNGHISILVSHIRTEDKKLGAFLNK